MKNIFFLLNTSFWEIYWVNNTLIAQFIILIILSLLLVSCWMFYSNRKRVYRENRNLGVLRGNLIHWKESINQEEYDAEMLVRVPGDFEENMVTVYEASIEEDLMPGVDQKTMVFERLKSLQELRNTKSRLNVGVLQNLSEIQDARHISSKLPSYVMTLSMLLGMLGTFIGLTELVGEISAQLQGFDTVDGEGAGLDTFKSSFEGIQNVMQGVGTAFTTTLMGLFTTIVVSALNFLQNRQKAEFFDHFEQFTVKELLPYTFPDLEQEEVINAIKDQLRETFEKLNRTIDKNRKTLGTIDGLYSRFDSVVDTVKGVMAAGGTSELHNVLQEMQTVNHNLVGLVDKYENKKLLEDFELVANKYDGYLQKHDFILEQSKWLPNARVFMIIISSLLGVISIFLALNFFF